MLEVLKFLFSCIAQIISLLFSIDLGFMSLGMFLCCATFGIPTIIAVFNFLKGVNNK